MAVRYKNGYWSVYYRHPDTGKQVEESFGSGASAEAAAYRRNDELGLGKKLQRKRRDPTVAEIARDYYAMGDFNPNSRKCLTARLSANLLPFFGKKTATGLTDSDIDLYVKKRRHKVKNSTIRRELTDLYAILNWAVRRRPPLLPFNPVRGYPLPRSDDAVIDPPTVSETQAILNDAPEHLQRFIRLSWHLGARPGAVEILSLTWRNFNEETRSIRIRSAAKGKQKKTITRFVPIVSDTFFAHLLEWKKVDGGTGPIIHYHGKAVKSIHYSWTTTLKKAGITRRIRPYDLRHRFITSVLEDGGDIKALSEIVGSRPETIMRHYQHVTRAVHRQVVAKVPELEPAEKPVSHTNNVWELSDRINNLND